METSGWMLACCVGAALCAGVCGLCLVRLALERVRRGRMAASVEPGAMGVGGRLVRNGVAAFLPAARLAGRVGLVHRNARDAVLAFEARGVRTTEEAVLSVALAAAVSSGVLFLAATRSLVCAVAVPLCAAAVASAAVSASHERRREAARDAVPDALRAMGACFQSGLSLLQTFRQVASEARPPLSGLFARAAHRLETGRSVEEALAVFREGEGSAELAFVAVALSVQHESGGSMRQVLEAARETVEGEIELARSLRVQTAQAKLSARVVSVMPFALIALFSVISEGFLEPFFASAAGLALLGVALAMQLAGIVLVRRMLAVEVSG